MSPPKPPAPVAKIPAEFKMVPAGPHEIGKGQRWEAVIREEGSAVSDVFPAVYLYALSDNVAANIIEMVRIAVRAELDARAQSARARTITKKKGR